MTRVIARPEPVRPNPRQLLVEVQEAVQGLQTKLETLAVALRMTD